jgi:hypothetical protein
MDARLPDESVRELEITLTVKFLPSSFPLFNFSMQVVVSPYNLAQNIIVLERANASADLL